jgi:SAM-dependent methyltransferase
MAQYVLPRSGAEETERERLTLLERLHDPLTVRQLDAIGVGPGWRCLDVGAGGGSVTRLLAGRVGETGSVLAVDLDPRLLEPLAGGPVEVRRHDLLGESLPESDFDLVHARLLLIHLPRRLEALRRMVAAVRPGGWIAVLDVDFTTVELSPPTPAWLRARSAFLDAAVSAGWDPAYGSRLAEDLEGVGLQAVEAERHQWSGPGGSDRPRLLAMTLDRLLLDHEDLDAARSSLGDADSRYRSPTTTLAIGRRPVSP